MFHMESHLEPIPAESRTWLRRAQIPASEVRATLEQLGKEIFEAMVEDNATQFALIEMKVIGFRPKEPDTA